MDDNLFLDLSLVGLPVETKLTTVGELVAKPETNIEEDRVEGWLQNWGKAKGIISTNMHLMKSTKYGKVN